MPSFTATTAVVTLTGGAATFIPPRFSADAARLVLTPGTASWSIGLDTSTADTTPTLSRLKEAVRYFDEGGRPTINMQLHWQRTMEAIELAFSGLTGRVDDIDSLLAQIQAANALATAASGTATEVNDRVNVALGFVDPVNVLSAASSGAITIAAHDRIYGDGTTVAVNSGSVSGFAPGDYVSVYYQDAGHAGGAVTYYGTTSAVVQSGSRHVVGQVTVPAIGAPSASGAGVTAPGYTPPVDITFDIPYFI